MNPEMLEDLGRWERGEVSVDDLAARHPHADPAALAEMHTLVAMLTTEPDTDRGPSWERLRASLPPQVAAVEAPARRPGRLKYFLAAFVTGAVIAPGTAAADGVEIIREVTEHVGRGLGNLVMPDRPIPTSAPAPLADSVAEPVVGSGSTGLEIAAAPAPLPATTPTGDPVAVTPVVVTPASPSMTDPVSTPRYPAAAPSPASALTPVADPPPPAPSETNADETEPPSTPPAHDVEPSAGSMSRPQSQGSNNATVPEDPAGSPSSSASSDPRGGDHPRPDRGNEDRRKRDERGEVKDRRGQT